MHFDVRGARAAESRGRAQQDLRSGRAAAVRADLNENVGGAHCDDVGTPRWGRTVNMRLWWWKTKVSCVNGSTVCSRARVQ